MCEQKHDVDAPIRAHVPIGAGAYALTLSAPALAARVQPGQFVEVGLNQPDLVLRRPFSVFDTDGETLTILYQALGRGTTRLTAFRPGTVLRVAGPLGRGWPASDPGARVLLVGGGIGAAPLHMLAVRLSGVDGTQVTLIQAARTAEALAGCDRLADAVDTVHYATDDGTRGHQGLVTEPVAAALEAGEYDVAYVCGPEPMMQAVSALTVAAGIQTWVSMERLMACGVGACLSCVLPTRSGQVRVCVDGPVFDAQEVDWDAARSSRVH
ncbi:MAG: dihydroorotate dehydrogenase electron transfer subunit [Actinomycetes bacterium]|jgi:dihydroorotate dehydrogenase electron transfer subunit|nr:dihydroorotate dehydrogenase electron transfer subunit [Actinomycetes bacterium]